MIDVFLSYRNTEERRRLVVRLATILRAYGINVWWDYGLEPGAEYAAQIQTALREAKVVIPFWCSESVTSDWVLKEARTGGDKLLPARLERVSPPSEFEALHAAHLENWEGSILDPALDEFIGDICERLGIEPRLAPDTRAELSNLPRVPPLREALAASGAAPVPAKRRRGGVGLFLIALVIVGAVGLGAFSWRSGWLPDRSNEGREAATQTVTSLSPAANEQAAVVADPNDPLLPLQWYLGPSDQGGAGILDYRRRTGATGEGVTIAIIDTGVVFGHEAFLRSEHIVRGVDLVSDVNMGGDGDGRDLDPADSGDRCGDDAGAADDSLHGTLNASLIAANTNNGRGMTGIAPDADLIVIRAMGRCGGRLSDINDAIRWAVGTWPMEVDGGLHWNAMPADIIVLPIGLFERCPASMQDAISAANERGVLVIGSAGNARIPGEFYTPASCDGVIAVGASDIRGHPARYSNTGADLLAPGGDLQRDDNNDGRPDGIVGARYATRCQDPLTGAQVQHCEYSFEEGTSMSAAIAGGAIALLLSQHPDETAQQIEDRFLRATRPMSARECSGSCDDYPQATPIPGLEGICHLPCGRGRLDLSLAD